MEHSFNKVIDLLYLAKQDGVEVVLNEERLQIKIAENREIDENLLREIRNNKQSIIEYLSADNWKVTSIHNNHNHIDRYNRNLINQVPLSFSQERLWFIDQLEGSVQYHSPSVMRLKGKLDRQALADALKTVIGRHDILRTLFREIDGKVYQFVRSTEQWQLESIDGSKYKTDTTGLKTYLESLVKTPFDLSHDFPVRGSLIHIADQDYILVVTMHHIASDAWSIGIIVKEVVELYNALVEGREAVLPVLPLQYADYAVWQRNYLQGDILDNKITYWKKKLQDAMPLQLPTDFGRPAVRGINGGANYFRIDKTLTAALNDLSRQQGASLFMVVLSVFKVLLYRYSGQQDISVGTSIASRQQKELEGLIGFFVNTLTLRDEVLPGSSFTQLLQQVKATTLEAYQHQELPFEKVVEAVVTERDMGRSPLFQVMLVLQNTPESTKLKLGEVELSGEPITSNISKFDFTFFVNETSEGLQVKVEYSTDLYTAATIRQLAQHFEHLLQSVVDDPQQQVGLLPMLGEEERQQLLEGFNNSEVAYPTEKTVIDIFEEQVARSPKATALVFEEESLSYETLNERSNQLANYLLKEGVQPGSLVPLYVERSANMLVGMLGIMKAGAAYVPVDTDFPAERIRYMLEDTAARVIVSSKKAVGELPAETNATIIAIDGDDILQQPATNPTIRPSAGDLAYVIYTSGSTGKPKGAMIEHRSLLDYYYGLNLHTHIGQSKSFALVSTIATDLGNTVIYGSLLSGGTLHVFSKDSVSNIEYLHDYFSTNKIDCLKIVPSHWKALSMGKKLLLPKKLLVFGGEALQTDLVNSIWQSSNGCRVVNHYGPTETTIGKLLHTIGETNDYGKTIPIGKPFSNTRVYVLSKELQLCPIGVPGQLFIAGDGLARGYFNNEALTKEKFINDPFATGEKMYGTGDLVKWLPTGDIEFIGRVDDQVKIRGYRVELGEIESILQQSPEISQAVVLAKEDKQGNKRLVAYIVPTGDFDKESVTGFLKEKLPDYMVPVAWVELSFLPLTANGKIDRKALPDPDMDQALTGYTAPGNETESTLATLWQDVLEVEQVGIHDDFFELGGHSLLAVRLVSAIRKAFTVEMPIGDIFDYPTVALLATRLSAQPETDVLPTIQKAEPRPAHIPLSFSQERLWFIDQLGGSLQYHIPAVLRLQGSPDIAALANALQQIINRHEVLRTVIISDEGNAYQSVKNPGEWQLQTIDGAAYRNNPDALQQFIKQSIDKPFDLSADYMIRATLVAMDTDDHLLVVVLHHIASDGWSTSIMIRELVELYHADIEKRPVVLPELPVQYPDYAIWQRNYLQGEMLEAKLGYWKQKLEAVSPLQLPTDFPRPAIQSSRGAMATYQLDKDLTDRLRELGQQEGTTLFMTLLAALNVLLYRYSGQHDIAIGTPVAGRQQQEIEGLIGFFINTLVLRSQLDGSTSFRDLLHQVRNTTLEAYAYQDVPFEKVVDAVVKERDMSRSPLFQVMVVLQNTPENRELRLGDVQLSRGAGNLSAHTTAKFELTFNIGETDKGLQLSVEYCSDLYKEDTIKKMMTHFNGLLNAIVQSTGESIGQLPMLTPGELQQLLVEFNNTSVAYPQDTNIIALFEAQVAAAPASIALSFQNQQFTYKQLDEKASQLACYLISKGVQTESLVPICIDRGPEMLVALLGVLKAGAAYVPIDPDYPQERIRFMLEDTAAKIALTSRECRGKLPVAAGLDIIELDGDWLQVSQAPVINLQGIIQPHNLAYIIYTSGSTGRPKGVMVEHRGVVNLALSQAQALQLRPQLKTLQFASFGFDASCYEIFNTLLSGGQLVMPRKEDLLSAEKFEELINRHKVDLAVLPPSFQLVVKDSLATIKTLVSAGEPLNALLAKHFQSKGIRVINAYGPTENTVCTTLSSNPVKEDNLIVIGNPIDNVQVYILDKTNNLCPPGTTGEICIAGVQVARGYLNRADLTAAKFINDPFATVTGARLYKSGDLGRWLSDGNIVYMGRIDEQVKIRGFRIELGEIENVLLESELVKEAVVLAKEDLTGSKRLVGYFVPVNKYNKETIIAYLRSKVPEYMVPSVWLEMEQFPLTPNGKIDRKALRDPADFQQPVNQYKAPRNQLEAGMAEIWQQMLKIETVGIHDNFFELGGNSLHAVRVVSIIKRKMEIDFSINDIFIYPTIAELIGNYIERIKNPSLPAVNIKYLVPVKPTGHKPPLYIVAGGGGTALRFKKFATLLDTDQPVFVLQPPIDTKNIKDFPDTIEGIAAKFIEEIMIENPNGPYALSGHCLGGIIAYEMAKQLQVSGKKVSLLGMFDTIIRKTPRRVRGTIKNLYHIPQNIQKSFTKVVLKVGFETFLLRKHTRQSIRYKMDTLRAFLKKIKNRGLKTNKLEFAGLEIFDESSDIYANACKKYKLVPYTGSIVLFYAKEHYFFLDKNKNVEYKKLLLDETTKNMWKQFSPAVTIHEIEGEHSEIFDPVNGDGFAIVLQQHLDKY